MNKAANRDGVWHAECARLCPPVLNLKIRWVFITTRVQSCSELVIMNETGNLHKMSPKIGVRFRFQQRNDTESVLHRDYCARDPLRHSSSNYQVTSADGGERALSAPAGTNKEPCRDVGRVSLANVGLIVRVMWCRGNWGANVYSIRNHGDTTWLHEVVRPQRRQRRGEGRERRIRSPRNPERYR